MKLYIAQLRGILARPTVLACGLSLGAVLLLAPAARPAVLNVAWDECPEAKSYLIYWGQESGQYAQHQVVPASPCQYRLSGLDGDTTYYLALKATSNEGTDSPFSEEVSAATLPDGDGDGISDSWESQYGFNPSEPADAQTDADSDGYSNLEEYNRGSDPLSAASVPPQTPTTEASQGGGGGGCFIATAAYGSPLAAEVGVLRGFRDGWLLRWAPGRAFVGLYYDKGPAAARYLEGRDNARWLVRGVLLPLVMLCGLVTSGLGQVLLALACGAVGCGLLRRSRCGS
jgi:hypothetical protein